ncbi:MAG TPA: ribosome recycling factor [Candidatus Faeciplasma avium]|uniref:Ribosome-recycling factor n=1 Tax=Candidatus Faeciplasma avium TaxID=2840798 RepID=A0A9D1T4L5_9FIRM|nr:ribosome recycling factor [Candidatus Faeciplasma avium]
MKEILNNAKARMEKTLGVLSSDFASIRAGRANPAVLDRITVDYYGTQTPINQMAAISVSDARVLVIQPWDKTSLKAIEKAIQASDLGINPANDGSVIRLTFPIPSEERRKELCKEIRKLGEDSKIAVRAIRRDSNDKIKSLKKDGEVTEDDVKKFDKDIQNLTDKYISMVDSAVSDKEREILSI